MFAATFQVPSDSRVAIPTHLPDTLVAASEHGSPLPHEGLPVDGGEGGRRVKIHHARR